jgi:hypothetical protein
LLLFLLMKMSFKTKSDTGPAGFLCEYQKSILDVCLGVFSVAITKYPRQFIYKE